MKSTAAVASIKSATAVVHFIDEHENIFTTTTTTTTNFCDSERNFFIAK
jgi:hypothetical protein